jgi:GT2 family glycosyltransferase
MDEIELSIVIVNWNTCVLLEQCLGAVYQTVAGLPFEVLVVDNASQDGSLDMIREQYSQVRMIQNENNVGFARANNQAIRECRGQYILLLNSDAFLEEKSIQKMVDVMALNPQIGILGARLVYPDGSSQLSHRPLPTLSSEIKSLFGLDKLPRNHRAESTSGTVETGAVSGACLLARRAVFEQVGAFDESFFLFNEEVDLCCRAVRAGWKVAHLPAARVIHVRGGSTGQTAQRILMLYQGKRRYFAKHYGAKAERRLLRAMRLAAAFKVFGYFLLSRVNQGFRHKDEFWKAVSTGLAENSTPAGI